MYTSFPRIFTYIYIYNQQEIYIYINEYQIINLKWHIPFVNWLEATKH